MTKEIQDIIDAARLVSKLRYDQGFMTFVHIISELDLALEAYDKSLALQKKQQEEYQKTKDFCPTCGEKWPWVGMPSDAPYMTDSVLHCLKCGTSPFDKRILIK